jgi:hypothetical protein
MMQKIIQLSFIIICMLLNIAPAFSHDHLKAEYVPWGVDEYELFGLTKDQLSKEFKNKLHFNNDFTEAYISFPNFGPRFLLTYDKSHVTTVQRMFIDGCGCHIMGPILSSKVDALQFSIKGLSSLPNGGDKQDHQRMLAAQKLLDSYVPAQKSNIGRSKPGIQ